MPSKVRQLPGWQPREIVVWKGDIKVSWWFRGRWRGISFPTWERYDRSGPVPVLLEEGGHAMPVKPEVSNSGGLPLAGAMHGAWGKSFPQLCSWLCDPSYTDGTPMGAVSLMLKREGSVIRVTLKVADHGGIKCSAVESDPASALTALELLLGSPKAPWEIDPYPLNQGGKKKGK